MKGWRLFAALFLAAGLPIAVVVWAYLQEIADLGAWGRMNPLGEVAARLMDQVESQIHAGQQQVQMVAADPALLRPGAAAETLMQYDPYVRSGRFRALALELEGGSRHTVPAVLPAAWRGSWPGRSAAGVSELLPGPDGGWVVAITTPLGASDVPRGWLTGLFDVSTVLGEAMVDRMRVAQWGEAFIADGNGRIFLSANRGLVGRSLGELGLERAGAADGLQVTDGWRDARGRPHFVALADSHAYYEGPQNGWRVGLMVPEGVVGARSRNLAVWIGVIIAVVLAITAGLGLVLRHSMRGSPR